MPDEPATFQPAVMNLAVRDQIYMTEIRASDKAALIQHLNDREIYDRTLRIPFPYTEDDAEEWLALVAKATKQHGQPVNFAIRNAASELVGGCGFDRPAKSHRAEIGYWLAKPYWNRGIMTDVVRAACEFAFAEWGLVKISAHVFSFNPASVRVLEKCGFEQEGFLKKHFQKDGQFIDAKLFALVGERS